jgi:hypothetical protein
MHGGLNFPDASAQLSNHLGTLLDDLPRALAYGLLGVLGRARRVDCLLPAGGRCQARCGSPSSTTDKGALRDPGASQQTRAASAAHWNPQVPLDIRLDSPNRVPYTRRAMQVALL